MPINNVRQMQVALGADVSSFVKGMGDAKRTLSGVSGDMRAQFAKINATTDISVEKLKLIGNQSQIAGVKMQGLGQKISLQQGYVKRLSAELDVAKNKFGATSKEVGKLELQLLKATKAEVQMQNELKNLKTPQVADNGMNGMLASFSKAGAIAAALAVGKEVLVGSIKYNSELQQQTAAFETLLSSAGKAKSLLAELKTFAEKTPFELPDLTQATKTLLAYGVAENKIMPSLKILGDISLGNKDKFESLAIAFGQVVANGRLMGQELNQMVNAGFSPLQVLAQKNIGEKLGLSFAEVVKSLESGKIKSSLFAEEFQRLKKDMEDGKITTYQVAEAMAIATGEGGRFYESMDKQSKTLNGQFSTLKDNWNTFTGALLSPAFDTLNNNILPTLNSWLLTLTKNVGGIQGAFSTFFNSIGGTFSVNYEGFDLSKQKSAGFSPYSDQSDTLRKQANLFSSAMGRTVQKTKKVAKTSSETAAEAYARGFTNGLANSVTTGGKTVVDKIKEAADKYKEALGLFDKATIEKVSGERLLERLKSQLKVMEMWKNSLAQLKAKLGSGSPLFQKMLELGPQSAGQIRALSTLNNSQLKEYESIFNQKSNISTGVANGSALKQPAKSVNITISGNQISSDNVDVIANQIVGKLKLAGVM